MPPSETKPSQKLEPGLVTEARLIEMVFPEQTNHYGTLFGGQALALMDKAAFVVASRYARRNVVTASSEKVDFHVPVRQGQLVELHPRVVATGRTSMTVGDLFAGGPAHREPAAGHPGTLRLRGPGRSRRPTAGPPLNTPSPGSEG